MYIACFEIGQYKVLYMSCCALLEVFSFDKERLLIERHGRDHEPPDTGGRETRVKQGLA